MLVWGTWMFTRAKGRQFRVTDFADCANPIYNDHASVFFRRSNHIQE